MYIKSHVLSKSIQIVYTFGLQTKMLKLHMHSICSVHSSSSGCFYYWKRRLRNPKQCSFCAKTSAENQYLTRDELSLSLARSSFTIVRIGEFCPRMMSSFLNVHSLKKCLGLLLILVHKWPQEKQACHSHHDSTPLSFQLQEAEDFLKIT